MRTQQLSRPGFVSLLLMGLLTATILALLTLVFLFLMSIPSRADVLHQSGGTPLDLYGVHVEVGNVIQVVVEEQIASTSTHDSSDTQKSKTDSTTRRGILGIFSGLIPASSGTSSANNKSAHAHNLKMTLGVRVLAIQGRVMELEGRRDMTVNGQKIAVVLHASASLDDLASTNSLSSTRLADLTLRIDGLPKKQGDDFFRRIFNLIL